MPDSYKPFWKDMLAEPAQELGATKRHYFFFVVAVIAPAEGHAFIIDV
jgi:hypothetical protein